MLNWRNSYISNITSYSAFLQQPNLKKANSLDVSEHFKHTCTDVITIIIHIYIYSIPFVRAFNYNQYGRYLIC